MRNTWASSNSSSSCRLRRRALSASWPSGFSTTIRWPSPRAERPARLSPSRMPPNALGGVAKRIPRHRPAAGAQHPDGAADRPQRGQDLAAREIAGRPEDDDDRRVVRRAGHPPYDAGMPVIGVAHRRLEGRAKVTGATRFTADLRQLGLAHARLLLSPLPAARIVRVDLEAARRSPGVLAAVGGSDLPDLGLAGPDQPLARGRVFFTGQPVAAVVAETEAQAADAMELVEVEYEPLPAALDPLQAMSAGSPVVLDTRGGAGLDDAGAHGVTGGGEEVAERPPNVTAQAGFTSGDVDAALT